MVGRRRRPAGGGGGGLILGDRQAQGACWDIMLTTQTADRHIFYNNQSIKNLTSSDLFATRRKNPLFLGYRLGVATHLSKLVVQQWTN
jgi:hypothetical protein